VCEKGRQKGGRKGGRKGVNEVSFEVSTWNAVSVALNRNAVKTRQMCRHFRAPEFPVSHVAEFGVFCAFV
jgi:hypothetical protein